MFIHKNNDNYLTIYYIIKLNILIFKIALGDDDLAAIQLLPYLFNPVNIKVPKKTTVNNVTKYSMRRPTKLEQASSVIVHITVSSKL